MAAQTIPQLEAQKRQRIGTRYAARLRKQGKLPAVVYGHGKDPLHVAIDLHEVTHIIHENQQLVSVNVEGDSESCLIKEMQWDHMGNHIIHVDLARVDLGEEVEVEVTVELVGEPAALQQEGAILDHPVTEITIACRADSIPDQITHDIESLTLDGAVTAADLILPEGVKLVTDPETIIAKIEIVEEMSDEDQAPAESAEPEVIGKAEGDADEEKAPAKGKDKD